MVTVLVVKVQNNSAFLFLIWMSVTRAVTAIAMMEATFTQQRMIGLLPTTFVFTLQGSDQAK